MPVTKYYKISDLIIKKAYWNSLLKRDLKQPTRLFSPQYLRSVGP